MTRSGLPRFALVFGGFFCISLGLVACASQQQRLAALSEGRVGCHANEMAISAVKAPTVAVGNEQVTWTVECRGRRFLCSAWTGSETTTCAPEVPVASNSPPQP